MCCLFVLDLMPNLLSNNDCIGSVSEEGKSGPSSFTVTVALVPSRSFIKPQFGFDILRTLFLKHANLLDLIWRAVVRQAQQLIQRARLGEQKRSVVYIYY